MQTETPIPTPESLIEDAAEAVGSQIKLAELLNVSAQAVSKWKQNGIPVERVLDIERHTGISRHRLRPDIYPADA